MITSCKRNKLLGIERGTNLELQISNATPTPSIVKKEKLTRLFRTVLQCAPGHNAWTSGCPWWRRPPGGRPSGSSPATASVTGPRPAGCSWGRPTGRPCTAAPCSAPWRCPQSGWCPPTARRPPPTSGQRPRPARGWRASHYAKGRHNRAYNQPKEK